jgi:hypothetical protein
MTLQGGCGERQGCERTTRGCLSITAQGIRAFHVQLSSTAQITWPLPAMETARCISTHAFSHVRSSMT